MLPHFEQMPIMEKSLGPPALMTPALQEAMGSRVSLATEGHAPPRRGRRGYRLELRFGNP